MRSSRVTVVPTVHVYTETRFDKLMYKFVIREKKERSNYTK
jgi:hypothetical protein